MPAAAKLSNMYVPLFISNNRMDLASTSRGSIQFKYEARPVVTRVVPSFGSIVGGTSVTVQGSGFVQSDTLV